MSNDRLYSEDFKSWEPTDRPDELSPGGSDNYIPMTVSPSYRLRPIERPDIIPITIPDPDLERIKRHLDVYWKCMRYLPGILTVVQVIDIIILIIVSNLAFIHPIIIATKSFSYISMFIFAYIGYRTYKLKTLGSLNILIRFGIFAHTLYLIGVLLYIIIPSEHDTLMLYNPAGISSIIETPYIYDQDSDLNTTFPIEQFEIDDRYILDELDLNQSIRIESKEGIEEIRVPVSIGNHTNYYSRNQSDSEPTHSILFAVVICAFTIRQTAFSMHMMIANWIRPLKQKYDAINGPGSEVPLLDHPSSDVEASINRDSTSHQHQGIEETDPPN